MGSRGWLLGYGLGVNIHVKTSDQPHSGLTVMLKDSIRLPLTASPGVKYVLPPTAIDSDDEKTICKKNKNHVLALEPRQNQICMPQNGGVPLQQKLRFDCERICQITLFASKAQTRGFIDESFACIGTASESI